MPTCGPAQTKANKLDVSIRMGCLHSLAGCVGPIHSYRIGRPGHAMPCHAMPLAMMALTALSSSAGAPPLRQSIEKS